MMLFTVPCGMSGLAGAIEDKMATYFDGVHIPTASGRSG